MRSTILAVALATLPVYALPGTVSEESSIITERAAGPVNSILSGASAQADGATYRTPGPVGSDACKQDKCCVWSYIAQEMAEAFKEGQRCSGLARQAIRLGFHDAAAWNTSMTFGGADGSVLLSDEIDRRENKGLQGIAEQTRAWFEKYKVYGISMADLIQFGANVATVVCPKGPRIRTFIGRQDSAAPAPQGLLPSPLAEAPALLQMFAAKTISPPELVALLGSHTVARQSTVDQAQVGAPQDSTPGTWDTSYFRETAAANAPRGVVRFPSDVALAHDPATVGTWQAFSAQDAQPAWNAAYAQAAFKMSLFGVKNLHELTECSAVLPLPRNSAYHKFKL